MKNFRKEVWFNFLTQRAFINITSQVEECLKESGIREGLVLIENAKDASLRGASLGLWDWEIRGKKE